jgi:SAM-dependent methyltransferase
MKYRDSGMPPQDYWETLFDVEGILAAFEFGSATGDLVELGCGYGTFTLPLARRTGGNVHAFDIDHAMIELTRRRAAEAGLANVRVVQRDVFADGFGLPDSSCCACLLFNILHGESPVQMVREAARVVRPGGTIAVIHWRSDIATPRGPTLEIRPRPEQILAWAAEVDGVNPNSDALLLPPWHFGLKFRKLPTVVRVPAVEIK